MRLRSHGRDDDSGGAPIAGDGLRTGAGLLDNLAELRFGFGDGPCGHDGHVRHHVIIVTIVVMLNKLHKVQPAPRIATDAAT